MEPFHKRWPRLGLLVLLLLFLLNLALENWITETALPALGSVITTLATVPAGYYLLGFFLLAIALLLIGAFESSPLVASWLNRPPPVPKPEPLSPKELHEIQEMRTMWLRFGNDAFHALHLVFQDLLYALKQEAYWAELLSRYEEDLKNAADAISRALADERVPLSTVHEAFEKAYRAYLDVIRWLANIRANEGSRLGFDEKFAPRVAIWQRLHRDMRDRLEDLQTSPAHNRKFPMYFTYLDDSPFKQLLAEAEGRKQES
jgi:hypothetical protein